MAWTEDLTMISKALKTTLLAAVAAASLSIGGTGAASAHGFGIHIGGFGFGGPAHWGHAGYWGHGGYWGGYRAPRFWRGGFVRWNGCPAYYVREGGLCYPVTY